jgi:hypothetical protein
MSNNNKSYFGKNNYVFTAFDDVIGFLKKILTYQLITKNQSESISNYIIELNRVKEKWASGFIKCLCEMDIDLLNIVGRYISNIQIKDYFCSPLLSPKISLFWNIIDQIPNTDIFEVITGQSSHGYQPNIEDLERIWIARKNTDYFIYGVEERNRSSDINFKVLDISAVLMTMVIRSEAHEFYLNSILDKSEQKIPTVIDKPQLLSVEDKVQRGPKYSLDVRAIRDSTAHNYFKIEKDPNNDYDIIFDNVIKGWKFYKKFTRITLLKFYQDFDRQFELYTLLISIKLLYAFLRINFIIK